jgi:large conductance mechanosensitive channel
MKQFLEDFKKFAVKGNVIDLAVAVVVGTAFTAIVNSLVNNILMPSLGVVLGGIDFSGLSTTIGDSTIGYGYFIQSVVNFVLIALVLFLVIKVVSHLKRNEEIVVKMPAEPSDEVKLLAEIRDLLKQ